MILRFSDWLHENILTRCLEYWGIGRIKFFFSPYTKFHGFNNFWKLFQNDDKMDSLNAVKSVVNGVFKEKEPWQIVTITTTTVLGAVWIWNFVFQDESWFIFTLKDFFLFLFVDLHFLIVSSRLQSIRMKAKRSISEWGIHDKKNIIIIDKKKTII